MWNSTGLFPKKAAHPDLSWIHGDSGGSVATARETYATKFFFDVFFEVLLVPGQAGMELGVCGRHGGGV